MVLMRWSGRPTLAVEVAPPIRKLCPPKRVGSIPNRRRREEENDKRPGWVRGSRLVVQTEGWYCSHVSLGYDGILAFEGSRQGRCHFSCVRRRECAISETEPS